MKDDWEYTPRDNANRKFQVKDGMHWLDTRYGQQWKKVKALFHSEDLIDTNTKDQSILFDKMFDMLEVASKRLNTIEIMSVLKGVEFELSRLIVLASEEEEMK